MEGMAQLLTREGPEHDEIRIIGVELAITPNDGHGEVELEMFAIPAVTAGHRLPPHDVRVTLHTSAGDVTLRGRM
jgi:hypothetical protein